MKRGNNTWMLAPAQRSLQAVTVVILSSQSLVINPKHRRCGRVHVERGTAPMPSWRLLQFTSEGVFVSGHAASSLIDLFYYRVRARRHPASRFVCTAGSSRRRQQPEATRCCSSMAWRVSQTTPPPPARLAQTFLIRPRIPVPATMIGGLRAVCKYHLDQCDRPLQRSPKGAACSRIYLVAHKLPVGVSSSSVTVWADYLARDMIIEQNGLRFWRSRMLAGRITLGTQNVGYHFVEGGSIQLAC